MERFIDLLKIFSPSENAKFKIQYGEIYRKRQKQCVVNRL